MAINKSKTPLITVNQTDDSLTIYINEIPHLKVNDRINAFQSWIDGDSENPNYIIQYYTSSGEYTTEYVDRNIWEIILNKLNNS